MRASKTPLKSKTITASSPRNRLTIGMIIDWFDDEYQLNLLYGITDLAKERDVNLLCFEGGALHSKNEHEARSNTVYNLVDSNSLDGLIVGSIGPYATMEQIAEFCQKYRSMPLIYIGDVIESIPCCIVDDSGIKELIVHLIKAHGYRKFAFIKGIGTKRYDFFQETLAEYQIPFDDNLIFQGDYTFTSGEMAIKTLLDERKAKFDVVVACNDDMACGALHELNARGIKVPEEVAVTGFDNFDLGKHSSPALTTVGTTFYELGRRSAEMLLDLIVNKKIPWLEKIPTKLIVRESCGCPSPISLNTMFENNFAFHSGASTSFLVKDREFIVTETVKRIQYLFLDVPRFNLSIIIEKLLDSFYRELAGQKKGEFFKAWEEILPLTLRINGDIYSWQIVMSELHNSILPYFNDRQLLLKAEDLLHQTRITISEKAIKLKTSEHNEIVQINQVLSILREKLLTTPNENVTMNILANTLPEIGIPSCYLAMFESKKRERSRLILAYDEQGRKDHHGKLVFSSYSLLLNNIMRRGRRVTMIVVALNLTIPKWGFILFEMGPHEGRIYGELRRIIGSTIQTAFFFKQIHQLADRLRARKESLSKSLIQSNLIITGFIQAIALTVESRDPYTAGHQHRVAELATAIATEMKLSPDQIEVIQMAGIIHDLGKISLPSEILNKPGRLNALEFNFIKSHPEIAYSILENIDFPWPIAQIILQHHEKIDGSGYPFGLTGPNIKLEAKILTVADVVEAMMSHRPYRAALGLEKALREIKEKRDILYDPRVVDECIKLFQVKGFQFKN